MIDAAALEHCRTFINCHLEPAKGAAYARRVAVRPAVTISRQAGCGALVVAQKLAAILQRDASPDDPPWDRTAIRPTAATAASRPVFVPSLTVLSADVSAAAAATGTARTPPNDVESREKESRATSSLFFVKPIVMCMHPNLLFYVNLFTL